MIKMPEVPMGINSETYRYLIILYQNLLELEDLINKQNKVIKELSSKVAGLITTKTGV